LKDSTTDVEIIRKWWAAWPTANIGITTGAEAGFFVLDVDGEAGRESLENLVGDYGPLPDTPEAQTGGGGRHILFRHPGGVIKNRVRLAPGLDIRADGGYFVASPSRHISGRCYEWDTVFHPDEMPLAEAPAWLLALITRDQPREAPIAPENVAEGGRNDYLFRLACSMRRRGASEGAILAALNSENVARCRPPLEAAEVEKIAASAGKYTPEADSWKEKCAEEWPEPEEIPEGQLCEVANLPPAIIPNAFRPWLVDVANRMQCPLDFVAAGAVVVAASVIGAGCTIRPKKNDDWTVVPNLWGGVVGGPSMLKTPALAEVMKPLKQLENDAERDYEAASKISEADEQEYKARKDALQDELKSAAKGKGKAVRSMEQIKADIVTLGEPDRPARRRYKCNDATIEKLGALLKENPRGLLVFRDELTGLLASWERDDRHADRAFYLEAWNGYGDFFSDRIGRGTVGIQNFALSLLGGIQPGLLNQYLLQAASSLQNDGMIQRFQLIVYPDEPEKWNLVDKTPDVSARERARGIIAKLADMDFFAAGAIQEDGDRPFFRFDDGGQQVFYTWLTEHEAKCRREDSPLLCEHLTKYRKLMPALALVFHLVGIADGGVPGPVTAEAARKAAAWCEYLETHARRIYGLLGNARMKAASALAGKIKARQMVDGFSLRDVYLKGWQYLSEPELVSSACRELEEAGWLRREVDRETGGRPKAAYHINPKIFS
jgi:hypothetical protein